MRRFLITSPKFTGTAEVVYNTNGTLCMLDMRNAGMDEMIVAHFKHATPAQLHKLLNPGAVHPFSNETVIIEADFEMTFDIFYKDYPLKRNRYKVEKAFNNLSKSDQVKAFYSLDSYKKYLTRNSWQTPMIGDRFLRDREFETEWNKIK